MSGLNNGHIHEFPYIRVDSFSQSQTQGSPAAQLYLLTHAHTDHLTGLDSNSTNIIIICSEVTKRLVLNYEREKDRIAYDRKVIERRKKAYQGLAAAVDAAHIGTMVSAGQKRKRPELGVVRDPFHVIPFDEPRSFDVGYDPETGRIRRVIITMLDANHCPGSAMFLLTDPYTGVTVLHTGDVRPDRPFLDRLERHPAVMPYLAKMMGMDTVQADSSHCGKESEEIRNGALRNQRLERIYLDTSAVIGTCDMPSKEEAVRGLIQTLQMYPPDTIFFIYTWTTGYEEALKAIAMIFGTKIHVDRWRNLNYQNVIDDPVLQMLCTSDADATRFHSCERRNQCTAIQAAYTSGSGKRVVTIDFVEEKAVEHAVKMKEVHNECLLAMQGKGPWPTKLYCPLARHATLPELQALLDLFRPRTMSPNTLLPFLKGADFYAMVAAFGDCLAPGGKDKLRASCLEWFRREKGLKTEGEVWAFAKQTLLFQGSAAPAGSDVGLDLRAGRSANRQRQSDAFLPSLQMATKSTLNSPKANSIPPAPSISISPSAMSHKEEDVPVFGKTDAGAYIKDYLADQEDLMDEDDQDTQVQRSREMRNNRSARSVLAFKELMIGTTPVTTASSDTVQDKVENGNTQFIVFPASPHSERILKRMTMTATPPPSTRAPVGVTPHPIYEGHSKLVEEEASGSRFTEEGSIMLCESPELVSSEMQRIIKKIPSAKKTGNIRISLRNSLNSCRRP